MINIQLYLTRTSDYDQIELFDFEGIELVQSVQDVRDISKVFAEFTRSFTVPASKNNNKALPGPSQASCTGSAPAPPPRPRAGTGACAGCWSEGAAESRRGRPASGPPFRALEARRRPVRWKKHR